MNNNQITRVKWFLWLLNRNMSNERRLIAACYFVRMNSVAIAIMTFRFINSIYKETFSVDISQLLFIYCRCFNVNAFFLSRRAQDYKKPLEDSNPPILNSSKIAILFHRLPEILHCHTLFRIALSECVRNWDQEEKVADAFIASFGKPIILEIYSGFINNFSAAMELAKSEAKRKSALADFFKVKQISARSTFLFWTYG